MKRGLNYVLEVEINFMSFRCIGESIERLLRFGFEIFDNTGDLVNRRLIDQTARSINQQASIFVKLNLGWELHFVYSQDMSIAFACPRIGRAKALIRNRCSTRKRRYFAAILFLMMPMRTMRIAPPPPPATLLRMLVRSIEPPPVAALPITIWRSV